MPKISQLVRRGDALLEYKSVYGVHLSKKERDMDNTRIKLHVKAFVMKNYWIDIIETTPVYLGSKDRPMITVTLASQKYLLFIIYRPKKS